MADEIQKKKADLTDVVLVRFNELKESGLIDVPKDYSANNALKSAYFSLLNIQDKNKKPALEVCSQTSIINSLFEMVTTGLNPMKKQCYFVVFGSELQLMRSYQGSKTLAKRYSGVQSIIPQVIYEKDKFITEILSDGREVLKKHEQPIENIDGKIIGGYCVIIDKEGKEHLTKMTINKIESSWRMGAAKGNSQFHKEFDDEAVKRTVTNRACKPYINSSNDEVVIDEEAKNEKSIIEINSEIIEEKPTIEIKSQAKKDEPIKQEEKPTQEEEEGPGY